MAPANAERLEGTTACLPAVALAKVGQPSILN